MNTTLRFIRIYRRTVKGGKTGCKCMGIEGDKGGYIDMGIGMLRIYAM